MEDDWKQSVVTELCHNGVVLAKLEFIRKLGLLDLSDTTLRIARSRIILCPIKEFDEEYITNFEF